MSAIYRKGEELGRGPFTAVCRGWDTLLDREVAIKEPVEPFLGNVSYVRAFVAHGLRVVDINHPNVLCVFAVDPRSDQPSLVREMADRTLGKVSGTMDPFAILRLLRQILGGLDAIHGRGLLHGALKPDNLFSCGSLHKIGDFGPLRVCRGLHWPVGHLEYLSPETLDETRRVSPASDIYSLGIVTYELALGRALFESVAEDIAGRGTVGSPTPSGDLWSRFVMAPRELPTLSLLAPGMPAALSGVIEGMVRRDPAQRYARVSQVLAALAGAEQEIPRASALVGRLDPRFATERPQDKPPSSTVRVLTKLEVATPIPAMVERRERLTRLPVALLGLFGILGLGAVLWLLLPRLNRSANPPAVATATTTGTAIRQPGAPAAAPRVSLSTAVVRPGFSVAPSARVRRDRRPREGLVTEAPIEASTAESEASLRQRHVAIIRERLRDGIREANAAMSQEQFDSVRERIAKLLADGSPYENDLRAEVNQLRLIDERAADGIVEARTTARLAEMERNAWERRLAEIDDLIQGRSFPEAKRLADNLAGDPKAPAEVGARARHLAQSAVEGLRRSFSGGGFDSADSRIERKPPR